MTRTLTILAVVASGALAVAAAPASAGTKPYSLGAANDVSHLSSRTDPPYLRGFIEIGTTETLDMNIGTAKGRLRTGSRGIVVTKHGDVSSPA